MDSETLAAPTETFDGRAFLATHGLEEMAEHSVEAHDGTYTFIEALEKCKPFAQMITSVAVSLEQVPELQRKQILKQTMQNMVTKTSGVSVPDSKKK